jgi:predicted phage terminase large subunit-like protein
MPALKVGEPYDLDPRSHGDALWPDRHSRHRLEMKKEQDEEIFESLYQGDPKPAKGMLYANGFGEYDSFPDVIVDRVAYIDTADQGSDNMAAIFAAVDKNKRLYVTDIVYTADSVEYTEPLTASKIIQNATNTVYVESNSGGKQFARNIERIIREQGCRTAIKWFHQSSNKEARIITNASRAMNNVVFPRGWKTEWREFANDLLTFKKLFRANKHDDAPDALTGLIEKTTDVKKSYIF